MIQLIEFNLHVTEMTEENQTNMKKMTLLLFTFIILVGCSSTNEENNNLKSSTKVDNRAGVKEADAESTENEAVFPLELTEVAAQEVVYNHFLQRNIDMRELMDEVHTRDDYQLVYDNTTAAYSALEAQIADIFTPYVATEQVKELAELYAEINTCECDSFAMITPNMVNVKFTIVEQDADHFVARFIEIGEEYNPSHGTHTVKFVNEENTWKFRESEYKAHTNEAFDLDKADIANSGFNFSTYELDPMHFVEYRTVDGVELIVMENRGTYAGYDRQTGEIHLLYDY